MHKITTSVLCAVLVGCGFSDFNPDLGSLDGETEGTEATEGTETGGETEGTEETDSSGETDTGSTGDGDGDGDTGTGDGDGDGDGDGELGPHDPCDPVDDVCPADHTCTFATVDFGHDDYWFFFCEPIEAPPAAQIGDICNFGEESPVTGCFNSYCAQDGLVDVEAYCGGEPGTLDGCCVPFCHSDGNNGAGDCPLPDFNQCIQLGQDGETQGIGWCYFG